MSVSLSPPATLSPLATPRRSPTDPNYAIAMVDQCLESALDHGASDVHFQPRADRWEISFRIDGVLQPFDVFERSSQSDPVSRLMALAGIPSYCSATPQEGPLRWSREKTSTHEGGADCITAEMREMRLGVFPTVHGNRAAIRIMDSCDSVRHLDDLGFDATTLENLRSVCDSRDGWLLVAGPAGSGKTTTLYACLSHIAAGVFHRSVLTIEDPIESVIEGISQSQLQPHAGLTLASAMRSAVRQDAEVLLVSEIRDVDTAEAVLAASMTGHLCFSSIHAATIGATLTRLIQMKLPIFAIQSGLRGIVCQRLLRKLCDHCRAGAESKSDPNCAHCHGTGYRGRLPISQLLLLDDAALAQQVFAAVQRGCTAEQIDHVAAQAGIESLHDQAAQMIQSGRTDAAEVFRVLGRQR